MTPPEPAGTKPGYEWTQEGDKMIVRDVPIFVECKRGELDFGAEWIGKAMDKARLRQSEGYFPPLHIRHHSKHGEHGNVVAAGYFRITRTKMIKFKGSRRQAIMADLIITDPAVAQMVKMSRLPYRSVEIHQVTEDPGLDSLALLDHDVPFLELPMLELAESGSDVANATFCYEVEEGKRVMVAFSRNDTAHLLFNKEDMDPEDDKEKMQSEDDSASRIADVGMEQEPVMEAPDESPGLDVGTVCAAIRSGAISVAGMEEIVAAIKARTGEDPEAAEELAPELDLDQPAQAAVPGGESMAANKKGATQFAALAGENKALKGRLDAIEAERKREKDVNLAFARLKDKPLGSDLHKELTKFHADHGPVAFAAYVGALDKNVGNIPTGRVPPSESKAVSKVAQKYVEMGADAMDKAATFSAEWRELQSTGHYNKTEDRYVAVAMARAGFQIEEK